MQLSSTIKEPISEHIVLFVNSISGGQSGKRFIDLEVFLYIFRFKQLILHLIKLELDYLYMIYLINNLKLMVLIELECNHKINL